MPVVRWGFAAKLFAPFLCSAPWPSWSRPCGLCALAQCPRGVDLRAAHRRARAKARQVETYFKTTRDSLRLIASSKMAADARRSVHEAVDELDMTRLPEELRRKLTEWYTANVGPELRRILGKEAPIEDFLPGPRSGTYLQYHYIAANPHPADRRMLLDGAGGGSRYSAVHALYHPLLRAAAGTVGFRDLMIADARDGHLVYAMLEEIDFATSLQTGPYKRSNVAAAVARCLSASDPGTVCLEDFAPYIPSNGAPIAFMAAPIFERGAVAGAMIAQLSIEEIDKVVTGDRQWNRERFGASGEGYLVGPDHKLRSGVRAFCEHAGQYFASLAAGGTPPEEIDAIRRYSTPILHQMV